MSTGNSDSSTSRATLEAVGPLRWARYVIRRGGLYFTGGRPAWTDERTEAVVFAHRSTAEQQLRQLHAAAESGSAAGGAGDLGVYLAKARLAVRAGAVIPLDHLRHELRQRSSVSNDRNVAAATPLAALERVEIDWDTLRLTRVAHPSPAEEDTVVRYTATAYLCVGSAQQASVAEMARRLRRETDLTLRLERSGKGPREFDIDAFAIDFNTLARPNTASADQNE